MNKLQFLIALVLLVSCSVGDFDVEEYHYLIGGQSDIEYFASYEDEAWIDFITDDVFDVVPLDNCSWINCKYEEYGYAYIHVDANETTQDRQCRIIVKNDRNNVRDTLTAYQFGIFDTTSESISGSGGSGSSTNTSSRRCAARTKSGKRCKRTASKGSIYCWQHKK